jgi:hypothetical protein
MDLRKLAFAFPVSGFLLLAGTTLLLFALGSYETLLYSPALALIPAAVMTGLLHGIVMEGKALCGTGNRFPGYSEVDLFDFCAVALAAIAAYYISTSLGHGAVLASGIVGMLGAVVFKYHSAAVFCGSFVGMACPHTFESCRCILYAGSAAGLLFVLSKGTFEGYGGKLGTIAFSGSLLISLLRGIRLQSGSIPGWEVAWLVILYSITGAVVTWLISVRVGRGPVMASSFIGIAAGLLLPSIHGQELGTTLAVMTFCASFAGMSSEKRLPGLLPVAIAGFFCGLMFMFTSPWMGGAGGKLGTIAFGSVIAVSGLMTFRRR